MTTDKTKNFFRVSAKDFKKIPGSPIAYWMSKKFRDIYQDKKLFGNIADIRSGVMSGDDTRFIRFWHEVDFYKFDDTCRSYEDSISHKTKWFPVTRGGSYRKWYGNVDCAINLYNGGYEIKYENQKNHRLREAIYYFREAITWTMITSYKLSIRYVPVGWLFGNGGPSCFFNENCKFFLSLLNCKVSEYIIGVVNPTINTVISDICGIPVKGTGNRDNIESITDKCISLSKADWDSYETSWDFQTNPLLAVGNGLNSSGNQFDLSAIYIALRRDWQRQTEEMRRLEIENNRIFIDAYGLQDELFPEVPWNEITLTCNPWYRYGKSPEAISVNSEQWTVDSGEMPKDSLLEARLLEDTIKEFISYAVGCMMGRYSPEKPGLILANQGEDIDRYKEILIDKNTCIDQAIAEKVLYSESTTILTAPFYPVHECCGHRIHEIADRDGVIPILDEEWFVDDIVAQFKQFLRFTFGEEYFADNLDFIEKALGKDLRKYFIKDFYKDHVQRYKKRPIYWMFSSPKGSFNALIYMHRYRPDTVSIVLNEYLREFISKIRAKREHLIGDNNRTTLSPAEKTRNLKQIDKYAAMLTELDAYERDILYPLAQEKIAIDLDDGVKVNYVKFGAALKKIPGLEAKEE